MSVARVDEVPRPQLAEAGLFLILVAAPLVVTPFTSSPFGDAKLLLVCGGTLALWVSGVPIDRVVLGIGAALAAATAIAAIVGVDPIVGLTAQTQSTGGGLILIVVAVALAAVGAAMPESLRERARSFVLGAGLAVAVIAIAFRVAPDLYESLFPNRALRGSTLGNPVFGAVFCSVALAAALGAERWSWRRRLAVVGILSFACATFEQRSGLILPVLATVVALWQLRPGWRRTAAAVAVVAAMIAGYELIQPLLPPLGQTGLGQLQQVVSDRARFTVWDATAQGWLERPVTGWGPASSHSAYIRGATPSQLDFAGRQWSDAHNVILETLVTTGIPGVMALLGLAAILVRRAWASRRQRQWAIASAVALGIFSLGEPLNVMITPLLFLVLGIAAGRSSQRALPRATSSVVAGLLAVATVITGLMMTSAAFERWGRRYGEAWALDTSLDLQPWRISAQRDLALRLSSDASSGNIQAASRAREVIDEAVLAHPWDPDVRLWAAQVEHLMGNDDATLAWIEEHVDRFPADRQILDDVRRNLDHPGFSLPDGMGTATTSQP